MNGRFRIKLVVITFSVTSKTFYHFRLFVQKILAELFIVYLFVVRRASHPEKHHHEKKREVNSV